MTEDRKELTFDDLAKIAGDWGIPQGDIMTDQEISERAAALKEWHTSEEPVDDTPPEETSEDLEARALLRRAAEEIRAASHLIVDSFLDAADADPVSGSMCGTLKAYRESIRALRRPALGLRDVPTDKLGSVVEDFILDGMDVNIRNVRSGCADVYYAFPPRGRS